MPPKARKLSTTVKSLALARTAGKSDKKKKDISAETTAELDYLRGLPGDASHKDILKVLGLFQHARAAKSKELLVAACEAIVRICEVPAAFMRFLEADVVETLIAVAGDPPEAGGKISIVAFNGLCDGTVEWMENVDPVDFSELSRLMYLSKWLGGMDEDVGVAAVDAIRRFTLHRAEHASGMVNAGLLNILHMFLSAHSCPEYVTEVFTLLYQLTDMPVEAVGEQLNEELGLVNTVVEALQRAPLNMRLQVAGLRLLALWATRLRTQEEIPDAIKKAGAEKVLEDAVLKLESGGFDHVATWLTTIAQRAFTEGLKLEPDDTD